MRMRNGYGLHKKPVEIFSDRTMPDGVGVSRHRAKISLGGNKTTTVSLCDIELLNQHSFHAHKRRDGQYVARSSTTGEYLHRIILGPESTQEVDHVNGDPLDNRRENLRPCSTRQNNLAKAKPVILKGQNCYGVAERVRGFGYRNQKGKIVGSHQILADAMAARDEYMAELYSTQQPNEPFHPYAFIPWNQGYREEQREMDEWLRRQANEADECSEALLERLAA